MGSHNSFTIIENKVFKIAKFEFKVTVHNSLYGQNVPSCDPLKEPDDIMI